MGEVYKCPEMFGLAIVGGVFPVYGWWTDSRRYGIYSSEKLQLTTADQGTVLRRQLILFVKERAGR